MKTLFFRLSTKRISLVGFCAFVLVFIFVHQPNLAPPGKIFTATTRAEIPFNVVPQHWSPNQPTAMMNRLEKLNETVLPGVLPDNARVAQDALDAIHEAAAENEKQQAANLEPPDVFDNRPQQNQPEEVNKELIQEVVDNEGIPFDLIPRRPPMKSTADSEAPGEGGKPVVIKKADLSPAELKKFEEGEKNNAFNEYASNMISVRRYLPDIREPQCLSFQYVHPHEPASIILCFHNEAWSVLLRSVHSILDRSNNELVKEIILVDDASTMSHLKKPLEVYMAILGKVKIVRAEERQGLIRARMLGAKAATGKVLIFLDSHIECTTGWLEPLLDRIAQNDTNVVVPVIDVISADTLQYNHGQSSSIQVGGFDWNLIFRWHAIPSSDANRPGAPNSPVRTPTMAGGLFAISTAFFERLGWYDPGYEVWGAENLELSFKTWMCGGQLETIPCSHVGHIFRSRSPYSWRVKQANPLKHNLLRLAEAVVGDEFKHYYFSRVKFRQDFDQSEMGNVSDRKKILKDLNCKSFRWYLDNIYPEMFIPGESLASGEIRNVLTQHCADAPTAEKTKNVQLVGYPCHNQGGNQYWLLSKMNEIRRDEYCLDSGFNRPYITVATCHAQRGNQHFEYTKDNEIKQGDRCMTVSLGGKAITMNKCDKSASQKWMMNRKPLVQDKKAERS